MRKWKSISSMHMRVLLQLLITEAFIRREAHRRTVGLAELSSCWKGRYTAEPTDGRGAPLRNTPPPPPEYSGRLLGEPEVKDVWDSNAW